MTIIFDGTQGITTPAETANNSVTTPVVKSSANLVFQSNGTTEAMRIDTSQRVGIGTSNPAQRFHVVGGQSYFTGASGAGAYSRWYNNAQTSDDFQVGQGWSSASDNVALLNNNANAAMIFGTNGTERMRIDSSGRVTLPYQTRFHATGNGQTPVIDGITQFPIIKENVGNCYNNSTMRFTAPIAGTYYFYGAIMANSGTGRMTWQFYKNGNTIQYMQGGGDSTNFGTWPGMMIITLAANDYIVMVCGQTPYTSTQEQYFGGYLIG